MPTAAVELDQDAVGRVGEVDLAEELVVGPGAELADRLGQSGLSQRLDGAVLELACGRDVAGPAPLEELTHESGARSATTAELTEHALEVRREARRAGEHGVEDARRPQRMQPGGQVEHDAHAVGGHDPVDEDEVVRSQRTTSVPDRHVRNPVRATRDCHLDR